MFSPALRKSSPVAGSRLTPQGRARNLRSDGRRGAYRVGGTGRISLAHNGKLIQDIKPDALRELLYSICMPQGSSFSFSHQERILKKLLLNNYRTKLTAVFIGALLWMFVYSEHNPQYRMELTVPVVYANLPKSMRVVAGPKVVRIRLRGEPDALKEVSDKTVSAQIDVEDSMRAEKRVAVNILQRHCPRRSSDATSRRCDAEKTQQNRNAGYAQLQGRAAVG